MSNSGNFDVFIGASSPAPLEPRSRHKRTQLTITVSPYIAEYIDGLAQTYELSKSAVVEQILAHDRENRRDLLMYEGYREMTVES